MQTPSADEILHKARAVLEGEGIHRTESQSGDNLTGQILPAMSSTRDIQTPFYGFEPPAAQGVGRKLKNTFTRKIKNIVVNVLERTVMRQQKYNELTYQAILELKTQIDELKRS